MTLADIAYSAGRLGLPCPESHSSSIRRAWRRGQRVRVAVAAARGPAVPGEPSPMLDQRITWDDDRRISADGP